MSYKLPEGIYNVCSTVCISSPKNTIKSLRPSPTACVRFGMFQLLNMGVSENSVPLNPMVNDHIIPIKWLFHWEYTLFSDKPICETWEILRHSSCFLETFEPRRLNIMGIPTTRWPGTSGESTPLETSSMLTKLHHAWWYTYPLKNDGVKVRLDHHWIIIPTNNG